MKYNDNLIEFLCDKLLVTKKEFTPEELNLVDDLVIDFYDYVVVNDDLDDFYSVDANKKVKIVETRVVVSDTQDKTTVKTKSVKIELPGDTTVEAIKAGSDLKACFELANNNGRTFEITKITTTVDNTADKTLKTGTHTIVVNEITTHETINGKTVNTVYTINRPITVVIK